MPEYHYRDKTETGKTVKGTMNAADERTLYDNLKKEGIYLTQ